MNFYLAAFNSICVRLAYQVACHMAPNMSYNPSVLLTNLTDCYFTCRRHRGTRYLRDRCLNVNKEVCLAAWLQWLAAWLWGWLGWGCVLGHGPQCAGLAQTHFSLGRLGYARVKCKQLWLTCCCWAVADHACAVVDSSISFAALQPCLLAGCSTW